MGTYVKTTGDLVTVRPKKTSAANQGRMLLDDALIEMLDIMLPVGELKTFSTDQVDSWIAKMAEYGQEWMVPEGQLLEVADYPDLFALIGYNYGWSDANPNTTYTYTFTDVNGASKSLTLYSDLDIDGNAKAVSGSPAYFRLPNYAGRFLRCVGTATYANKWSDADGNTRQLLTTYTAEMYKGKLDAQRGISGRHSLGIQGKYFALNTDFESAASGVLKSLKKAFSSTSRGVANIINYSDASHGIGIDSSWMVPSSTEDVAMFMCAMPVIRIF